MNTSRTDALVTAAMVVIAVSIGFVYSAHGQSPTCNGIVCEKMQPLTRSIPHRDTPLPDGYPGTPKAPLPEAQLQKMGRIIPPPEYDRPYAGKLILFIAKNDQEIRDFCPNTVFRIKPIGCAKRRLDVEECRVMIAADEVIKRVGYTREIVMRHEMAHCNGWPKNHPNARMPTFADLTKEVE